MNRIAHIGIFVLVAIFSAIVILTNIQTGSTLPIPQQTTSGTTGTPAEKVTRFSQNPFGVSFSYPESWNGPEVYSYDDGFRFEIGTDKVYPYGTDPTERKQTKKNNYYVVVQYYKKTADISATEYRKTQLHLKQYDKLFELRDGETISDTRSLTIKVRNINFGGLTGVEYISTLSEKAQTEMTYMREAVLFDTDLNILLIRGYPDNVEVPDTATWKNAYETIDARYLDEFSALVNSVKF